MARRGHSVSSQRPAKKQARSRSASKIRPGKSEEEVPIGTDPRFAKRLGESCAVWKSLNAAQQFAVLRDVVETRGHELRLAYPDLLAVGYGYQHRESGKKGGRRTVDYDQPRVAFLVKSKWRKKTSRARADRRHLPSHLFTFVHLHDGPHLCAVPTDVHGQQQHYRKTRLQGIPVRADSNLASGTANGVATCAVQAEAGGPVFLMSCHHVFAMSSVLTPVPNDVVVTDTAGNEVGRDCDFYGDPGDDFVDAALVRYTGAADVRRVVPEPNRFHVYPNSTAGIAASFRIHAPQGGTVIARRSNIWPSYDQLPYPFPARQQNLVEMTIESGLTQDGDSGSPVFDSDDATFQGMHIALTQEEDGTFKAFMLPAFEILRAAHLQMTSDETQMLRLV